VPKEQDRQIQHEQQERRFDECPGNTRHETGDEETASVAAEVDF
jgi:hypothetical protein